MQTVGMLALMVPFGLVAGVITTIAGLGGGQLLTLALALLIDPRMALCIAAPALLLGNAHRAYIFRAQLKGSIAAMFAAGAVPGSLVGGLLLRGLSSRVVSLLLLGSTLLAVARGLGWLQLRPRPMALLPAGVIVGALTAASSGAGLLLAPILLAAGLQGEAYVATAAACATAIHLGRISGYGLAGLFEAQTLLQSAVLAVAIFGGNFLGERIRHRLMPGTQTAIEYGALLICAVLAVLGLA